MSLINDALKRARECPAEQSAARRAAVAAGRISRARRRRLDSGGGGGFVSCRRGSFSSPGAVWTQGGAGRGHARSRKSRAAASHGPRPRRRRPKPRRADQFSAAAGGRKHKSAAGSRRRRGTLPKVQGIIFNAARPLAIVNGQTVSVGDRVGKFQVKQILKTSVVFQRPDGSQKTLGIGE